MNNNKQNLTFVSVWEEQKRLTLVDSQCECEELEADTLTVFIRGEVDTAARG